MKTLNPYLAPIIYALDRYLNRFPECSEHQLIKYLQEQKTPPFEQLSLAEPKELFSAHFLCMHGLYHLKKQYYAEQNFKLIIQSIRIQRIALAESEILHKPVSEQLYIQTANKMDIIDPLELYYLDATHYFETQEAEINDMLTTFWQKYLAQDKKHEALAVLNLPADADAHTIKVKYRRLAQQYHPDKGGCTSRFQQILQAKIILDKLF